MALNGVNMPLAVTGQEAVWQDVCRQLGMNDAQIAEFFAGPPYLPFQWMGCLDGHGGPLPESWIPQHEELEEKILARERDLGMTPVLQGFTGHVRGASRFMQAHFIGLTAELPRAVRHRQTSIAASVSANMTGPKINPDAPKTTSPPTIAIKTGTV